jgi:hypothetical protein
MRDNNTAIHIFGVPLKRPRTERQRNAAKSKTSARPAGKAKVESERASESASMDSRTAAPLADATPSTREEVGGAERVSVRPADEHEDRTSLPVHSLGELPGFAW